MNLLNISKSVTLKQTTTTFLTFCVVFPILFIFTIQDLSAQSPGGVSTGLELWLKADEGFSYTSATAAKWSDQSSNNIIFRTDLIQNPDTGTLAPTLDSGVANFNPAIVFDGANTGLSTGVNGANFNFSEWTVFSVQQVEPAYNHAVWHYGVDAGNTLALFIDPSPNGFNIAVNNASATSENITSKALDDNIPHILGFAANNTSGEIYVDNDEVATTTGFSTLPGNGAIMIGLDADGAEAQDGNNHLKGNIGEILMYNQKLSPQDQQKIQSYLALKYGISLNQASPLDYIASDGSIIWDSSENSGYKSGIFGIGLDNDSGLDQKVSKSANSDAVLTIALDNDFSTANNDVGRTTTHTNDNQFFVVAHNGANTNTQFAEIDATTYNARISREWKVDKTTTFTQDINLKFDGFNETWELIKDNDGDFTSGVTSLGTLDSNGEITGVTLSDGEYFTLAKFQEAPGGLSNDLTLWLKADADVTSSGVDITDWQDQTDINDFSVVGAPDLKETGLNYNPTVLFDGSSRFEGNTILNNTTEVFAVAKLSNPGNNTSSGAVLGNPTVQGEDYFFHTESNKLYIAGTGGEYAGTNALGTDIPFGILNADLSETPSADQRIKVDGLPYTNTVGGDPVPFNRVPVIGARDTENLLAGSEIAEVIVYDASKATGTERQQVLSYLALKYGITLDQSIAQNYLASDGSVIWDGTANVNYKTDIFGIGRDDASGLNQKISKAINSEAILTIALDANFTASNTDAARTTAHANDKQFLVVSNNGDATTLQTTEMDISIGLNTRIAREWKVDATNFTQNISMKFEGFDESWSLIATADGDFSSGVTIIGALNANGELTTTAPLADGAVFTLAKLKEAPGGLLSDLTIWLKADAGTQQSGSNVTANNATIDRWNNQVINGVTHFTESEAPDDATLLTNALNYNSVIGIDGDDRMYLAGTTNAGDYLDADSNSAYIIYTQNRDVPSSADVIFQFQNSDANNRFNLESNPVRFAAPKNSSAVIATTTFTNGQYNMLSLVDTKTVNGDTNTIYINGKQNAQSTNSGDIDLSNGKISLGAQDINTNHSDINIAEFIIFKNEHDAITRNRIESYLAVKYGFTLDQTSPTDYVSSDGTTKIWENDSDGYDRDIFGIGRDDDSGLNQKVSKSVNSGAVLTVALDNDFTVSNTDAGRTTAHANDKQFLLVANNGADLTTQETELDANTGFNIRLSREWKVDATNFSQNISMKFEGYNETWTLLKDTDGDFSSGATSVGTLDSNGEITGVTLNDGEYITLAKFAEGPGGILTNLSLWLKADSSATPAQWDDQSEFNHNLVQASSNLQPTVKSNGINFNPTVVFDGSDLMQTGAGVMTSTELVDTNSNNANSQFIVFKSTGAQGTIYNYSNVPGGSYSTGAGTNGNLFLTNRNGNSGAVNNDIAYLRALRGNNITATVRAEGAFVANLTGSNATLSDGFFNLGSQGTDGLYPFTGEIAEIINYREDVILNINRIESYLALKYGISLNQTSDLDYLASDGTIIWDATANTAYNNDIFGIGRDDISGLNQKISKSVNSGAVLTIALDNDFTVSNTDAGRTTAHANDKQFLIVSNNGGVTTSQTTEIENTNFNTRITREWKVDKTTNFGETINLKFDGFDETWSLIKDEDGDFSEGITSMGDLDSNGEITGLTLNDGDYFTLAKNDIIAPTITSFTPEFAGNGEVVTIKGTGFTGTSAITFGGVAAKTFTVNSDIEIVATVDTGASGDITVTNSAGNDSASGFLYKVVQYDFEGNALDETENNYDGTEINTVTYSTGAQGQAICFDNGPGFVKLPDNLIRSLSEFTISLRFKTTETGSILGYQHVQANTSNTPSTYIPILMIDFDGILKGTLWTNTRIQAVSSTAVNDGNWHQVDFAAGTNSVSIYVDGNLEASTTGAAVDHLNMIYNQLGFAYTKNYNTTPNTNWEYFTGCIDDMVIFDRKLTEAEIETITQLPAPTITSFDPVEAGQDDTVTITGTNFDGSTQVTFGGVDAASYTVDSSTQITAVVGSTAASGDVEVITAGGTATLSGFTFTSKSALTVSTTSINEIIYCANEISASESFQVSGTDLYEDLVITAPAGFEVSLSNGSGYANSVSLTPSSNAVASTSIYVRVASSQNGELSGNITVASGTESEDIAIAAANNNALYFDGDNDYVTLSGNTIADGASNFTIETWILPDNTNWDGDYHAIIGYEQIENTSSSRNPSFYIKQGKIHVDMYENNASLTRYDFITDDPVVLQDVWTHLALVKEGTEYRFYVNGELILTNPAPQNINITGPYQIGYINNFFAGKIDDTRFWNTPRSQTQIEDNMNVTLSGDEAGLVGYYTFNQGIAEGNNTSETTLIDKSNSNIDGTLNNMALTGTSSNWVDGYFAQITGSDSVYKNETLQLSHAQSGGVWSSDDTGIATVNQSGLVTGVSAGSVNINYALCGQTTYKSVSVIDAGFSVSETTLTISENAGTASFTVVLDAAPTSNVVFAISSNYTNEATVDKSALTFTSANWNTPQTVTVTGVNDDIDSDDTATITISVNDASSANSFDALADKTVAITLTDDDTASFTVSKNTMTINEDAGTGTFTVVLDTEPTSDVVFNITSSATGEATVDKAQLTFTTSNWNTTQTVTVTGVDDAMDRDDSATITIAVKDADSDDSFDALADKTVAITLTDDDTAAFTVSETTLTIDEDAGTDSFTVVLDTEPTSDVVFNITSSATGEATVDKAQLTFTTSNWNTTQTVTVTGVDDAMDRDDSATITIAVKDADSDDSFDALADKTVAITLTDDDTAAFTVSETTLTIDEDAGTDSFTVVLDTEPTSDVVFNITSSATGEATVDKAQLTFTTANWSSTQTVTVTGVDDNATADHTVTISIAVDDIASDDAFDPLTTKTIAVTLTNDDANFTIDEINAISIEENKTYSSVTPTLSGDTPFGTLTYTLEGNDASNFTINSATGVVRMVARDYENPVDANTDNVYEITIKATDSNGNSDTEDWTVQITNSNEIAGDTNGDGVIGPGEIAGDTNNDGVIGPGEIAGDTDGDGTIGSGEIAGDTDGDGTIGSGEIAGDTDGDGSIGSGEIAGDKDGDGSIGSGEVAGDADGDGSIGPGEVAGDADGDGSIGSGEIAGDKDGDGSIGSGEIAGDKDGDGSIGSGEVAGDSDGDGTIGSGEIAGDTDGDGSIGSGEVAGDTDGDGSIGSGEVAGDKDGDGSIGSGEIAGDADGDGSIGSGEVAGDTDGDGSIGFGEVEGDVDGDGTIGSGEVDGDVDTDGDGVPDAEDAFPNDPNESVDNDGDGIGANADLDDNDVNIGEERPVVPAQAFTPNGDNINDTWVIKDIENYPNAIVSVYNRYGHEVFKTVNYKNDWNGRFKSNSEALPPGSYYYVIDLQNGSAPVNGWIFINY
ncbi:LamG-like jellyroll fold domain-containing protein [Maribacter sp. X9]|uniref:LamG-like jellyroll fold domain-containing protein n=1 Tax=Maribacter sp. X9 TaxID=3402159 RepID=UPI003AF3D157